MAFTKLVAIRTGVILQMKDSLLSGWIIDGCLQFIQCEAKDQPIRDIKSKAEQSSLFLFWDSCWFRNFWKSSLLSSLIILTPPQFLNLLEPLNRVIWLESFPGFKQPNDKWTFRAHYFHANDETRYIYKIVCFWVLVSNVFFVITSIFFVMMKYT